MWLGRMESSRRILAVGGELCLGCTEVQPCSWTPKLFAATRQQWRETMERQGLWARGPKRTVACLCEMAGMLGIQSTLSEQSRAKRRKHGQLFILPIQVKTD